MLAVMVTNVPMRWSATMVPDEYTTYPSQKPLDAGIVRCMNIGSCDAGMGSTNK